MKIVLDTNCLIMVVTKHSEYTSIWQSFRNGSLTLCYSTEILLEYFEILSHFYSPVVAKNITEAITNSPNAEAITVYFNWHLITTDPDDNKFVDCAISANASYIVTNDRYFDILKTIKYPIVSIKTIDEFKEMI